MSLSLNRLLSSPVSTRSALRMLIRIVVLSVIALLITSYSVYAQSEVPSAERSLFDALNRERSAQGLPALQWDDSLAAAARGERGKDAPVRQRARSTPRARSGLRRRLDARRLGSVRK